MNEDHPVYKGFITPNVLKCAHPAPYPEVRVVGQNPYYARLLLEDFAGRTSELSAITQYIYHHFVLEPEYEEVANLLRCIVIVEMHHLATLGEVIEKLGVDPRYRIIEKNETEKYWNANFIFYGTALCDRLATDIAGEWAAIANYRKHQQMINDPFIKKILDRIILDEFYHIKLFSEMTEKYCAKYMPRE